MKRLVREGMASKPQQSRESSTSTGTPPTGDHRRLRRVTTVGKGDCGPTPKHCYSRQSTATWR